MNKTAVWVHAIYVIENNCTYKLETPIENS